VSQYLDEIERRIADVLCEGRGSDGSLGADAQTRSIPAGRFRWSATGVSQRDPLIPAAERDRTISLDWESVSDSEADANELDGEAIRTVRLTLLVGYVDGPGQAEYVHPIDGTAETRALAAANARRRALSDAERIRRALCWPDLYGSDTAPSIVLCAREGASAIEPLTNGVLLCATTYRLVVAVPMADDFDPDAA